MNLTTILKISNNKQKTRRPRYRPIMTSSVSRTRHSHTLLFHLTLLGTLSLTLALRPIVMTNLGDHICARAPTLQTLSSDTFIKDFGCVDDKTTLTLNCSHRGVHALPKTQYTPERVQVLDFSYNKIRCLPQINETLTACSSTNCGVGCVRELWLRGNEIDYLHPDAFSGVPCLNILDLSENSIQSLTLQSQQFEGLNHLSYLDLHGNPLHSLRDSVLVSTFMSQLHTLNLSSCQLEWVGPASLDHFVELQVLDLSRNKLKTLAQTTFQGLKHIQVLDLSWNKLQGIEKNTFWYMTDLLELRLHHNKLQFISAEAFVPGVPLPALDLTWNRFEGIPFYAISSLAALQSLDMSHNPISALRNGHVSTSVQQLRLDSLALLQEVEDGAFSSFPGLSVFSLRYARGLTVIPPSAFEGSTANLSEVRLESNGLAFLDDGLLPWKRLRTLTLHDNRWHCDCRLSWAVGYRLGNTTMRCEDPLKLSGQKLESLQPDELSCPVGTTVAKVFVALGLTAAALIVVWLVLWKRRRSLPCRCVRGTDGKYITIYTKRLDKSDEEEDDDGTCGQGDVDDLDLGNGEAGGARSEGGRVMIMLNTFRKGYKRLNARDSDSTQDLTLASDV